MSPVVSVLMSVHNGEQYLAEAVQSVLEQSFSDFEFIVIDDGSTDQSHHILQEYAAADRRISLVRSENRGLTRSLNEGMRLARGQYIARMDADDISLSERFAKQVSFLASHPEIVAVGCRALRIDPKGLAIAPWLVPIEHEQIDAVHLNGNGGGIIHPTAMIRIQALQQVRGYREEFRAAQDYDLWLRLAEIGRLANLPETLLHYRLHLQSISLSRRQEQCEAIRMIHSEACNRRNVYAQASTNLTNWIRLPEWEIRQRWIFESMAARNFHTAGVHASTLLRQRSWHWQSWWLVCRVILRALIYRLFRL